MARGRLYSLLPGNVNFSLRSTHGVLFWLTYYRGIYRVINGLIPLALQAISIVHFGKLIWQQQLRSSARSSAQYMPLLRSASKHSNYGSSRSDLEQAGCSTSNSSIITEQIRLAPLPCWSLYNVTRIVASAIQFGICCFALWHIWHHSYPLDIPVEGVAWSPVIAQYAIFACLWVRLLPMCIYTHIAS